jgi:hypothetical protein
MNTAVPLKSIKAEPLKLPEHRDAYYGGEWHKPKSGRYVDTINPGTAESTPLSTPRKKRSKAGATRHRWNGRGF